MEVSIPDIREDYSKNNTQANMNVTRVFKVFNILLQVHGLHILCTDITSFRKWFSIVIMAAQTILVLYDLSVFFECVRNVLGTDMLTIILSIVVKHFVVTWARFFLYFRHQKIHNFCQRFLQTCSNVPDEIFVPIRRLVLLSLVLLTNLILLYNLCDIVHTCILQHLDNYYNMISYEKLYNWPSPEEYPDRFSVLMMILVNANVYTETTFSLILCFVSFICLLFCANYMLVVPSTIPKMWSATDCLNLRRRFTTLTSVTEEFNECFSFLVCLWLGNLIIGACFNLRGWQTLEFTLKKTLFSIPETLKIIFEFFLLYLCACRVNEKARKIGGFITNINPELTDQRDENSQAVDHSTLQLNHEIKPTDVGISVWTFALVKKKHLIPVAGTMLVYLLIAYTISK